MKEKKNSKNIKELEKLLVEAEKQSAESLSGWQRTQADFENYKKSEGSRRQEIIEMINATFMSQILPVYNHFKLALKHIPEDQQKVEWVVGIGHIQKQFQDFLAKYKIEEIKTIGEKFDHNIHEAIAHEESKEHDPDMVFEEVQAGYIVDGKVLMPAKVKVAK
jgi:molecular chaperone GrpE